MQGQLDLIWEHLLPALKKEAALPANPEAGQRLRTTLGALALPPLAGKGGLRSGGHRRQDRLPRFQQAWDGEGAFDVEDGQCLFTAHAAGKDHVVACGLGSWVKGETGMPGTPPRLISGGASPRHAVQGRGQRRGRMGNCFPGDDVEVL